MKFYKKVALVIACILSLTACNGSGKKVAYTDAGYGTTVEQLTEMVGEEADTVKDENGLSQYIYEKTKYLDYTGKMTYYMLEGSSVFTRWEYIEENEEKGKKAYQKICEQMEKDYGESVQADGENSAIYKTQNQTQKTVLLTNNTEGSVISIVEEPIQSLNKENSETETSTTKPEKITKPEKTTKPNKTMKPEKTTKPKKEAKSKDSSKSQNTSETKDTSEQKNTVKPEKTSEVTDKKQ